MGTPVSLPLPPEMQLFGDEEREAVASLQRIIRTYGSGWQTVRKRQHLTFTALPIRWADRLPHVVLHHSKTWNGRQGSRYYFSRAWGRLIYVRISNHWGVFHTNIYADDPDLERMLGWTPLTRKRRGITLFAGGEADHFGRVGWRRMEWELRGGHRRVDGEYAAVSQAGYLNVELK